MAGEVIRFGTFEGFNSKIIDSTIVSPTGLFSFNFSTDEPSVCFLISEQNKPYIFIIDKNEYIRLQGDRIEFPQSIQILEGNQNQDFSIYTSLISKSEQVIDAWNYLERIYSLDSLFMKDKKAKKFISSQLTKIKKEEQDFFNHLDPESYVAWYLPLRKLITDVSNVAQNHTNEIATTIQAFRKLDCTDERLYRSGLLRDAVESHFWLLENSGKSLDSVFIEMKVSIDSMMTKLVKDEEKLNEITDYLFDLLERYSLFQASEYLALKVLNEVSCTIDNNLAKQLETYRAMKKGNIAPDFAFYPNTIFPTEISKETKLLSDLKSPYTLVVFGSSTCPKCAEEIPQIAELYIKWKAQGVEVVFISLDETVYNFKQFISSFPFISSCDFQEWKSPIVESYYVFGTPTMFLLDNKREILLRPNSVNQMDTWVDWFLTKGNR